MKKEDFDGLVTRLDDATNKIAAKQRAAAETLKQALENAGMLGDAEKAAFDALDRSITAVEALGADAGDPVPAPPTDPQPEV